MTKEALKLALEALETLDCGDTYKTHNAASALRKALAQPEQEPVAWRVSYQNDPELGFWFAEGIGGEGCLNEPLYTTPPQRTWVGLTDEEKLVANQMWRVMDADGFIQAIETKLKQKNI